MGCGGGGGGGGGGLVVGVFCWQKEKVWRAGPLCLFWTIWRIRNKIAFENAMLSIQNLQASFTYFLWEETKLFIKEGPTTLIGFIEWLGS